MILGTKQKNNFLIFTIIFTIYSFLSILSWSNIIIVCPTFEVIYRIYEYITIPILVLLFLNCRHNIATLFIYLFCFSLGIYSYLVTHRIRFLMFILYSFSGLGINYNQVSKNDFFTKIVALITVLLLYISGVLQDTPEIRPDTLLIRHTYGFQHPNFLIFVFMIVIVEYLILKKFRINILELLVITGITIMVGKVTDGRAGQLVIIFVTYSIYFLKNKFLREKIKIFANQKVIYSLLITMPELLAILSYVIIVRSIPGSPQYLAISKMFSGRLDIFQYYYNLTGLHLLPINVNQIYRNGAVVGIDNAYMYLLINIGLLGLFVYCIINSIIIMKTIKKNNLEILMIIMALLFLGLVEAVVIYPFVSIYIILLLGYTEQMNITSYDLENG